jgi:hypothetical protein
MLLCCDTINLVKKASKDLKTQRSLSRKRSQTVRAQPQTSSYTIVNHTKGHTQKDYVYERDTVNKTAKVKPLDNTLQESRQSMRGSLRSRV